MKSFDMYLSENNKPLFESIQNEGRFADFFKTAAGSTVSAAKHVAGDIGDAYRTMTGPEMGRKWAIEELENLLSKLNKPEYRDFSETGGGRNLTVKVREIIDDLNKQVMPTSGKHVTAYQPPMGPIAGRTGLHTADAARAASKSSGVMEVPGPRYGTDD